MEVRIYHNEEVEHGHADKSEFERTHAKFLNSPLGLSDLPKQFPTQLSSVARLTLYLLDLSLT